MNKKALQEDLKTLGFYLGSIDGSVGPMSKRSIKSFQKAYGLKIDGIPGPNTRKRLLEVTYGIKQSWYDKYTLVIKIPKTYKFNVIDIGLDLVKNVQAKQPHLIMCNGGMFGMSNGVDLNYMIDDNKLITRGVYSKWALCRFKDGTQEIKGMYWQERINNLHNIVEAIGGSPSLVIDGKINIDVTGLDYGFIHYRHPRLSIGYNDTHFIITVSHGRFWWSKGRTIKEQAELMLELGCKGAINVDGGGSIQVYDRYGMALNRLLGYRKVANTIGWC